MNGAVVLLGSVNVLVMLLGYVLGRMGENNAQVKLAAIAAQADDFLDEWYPLGIPQGDPKSALDIMAQVLEPLSSRTK